jgi:hypothetical protein
MPIGGGCAVSSHGFLQVFDQLHCVGNLADFVFQLTDNFECVRRGLFL